MTRGSRAEFFDPNRHASTASGMVNAQEAVVHITSGHMEAITEIRTAAQRLLACADVERTGNPVHAVLHHCTPADAHQRVSSVVVAYFEAPAP